MATENDDEVRDNGRLDDTAKAEKTERVEREPREAKEAKEDSKPKNIRDAIKSAIKEHAPSKIVRPRKTDEQDGDDNSLGKEAVAGKAAHDAGKEIPKKETSEKATLEASQALVKDAPPASLSKEVRGLWNTLDPLVRNEFLRREADSAKGVEQLKARYQPYDEALSPIRDELKSVGKTEAEAIRMLVDWRRALAGPNKATALRALAQAEGIDLSTFVPHQPGATQQQQPQQNDPASILRPYIDPINQKVTALESELQRRDRDRVQSDIQSFAKDKPHFDKVRVAMGHLMNSGLITGSSPKEVFDEAYNRACRMDPEVFAAVQAGEQAKREEEARSAQEAAAKHAAEAEAERRRKDAEAVEKARKAGVGPRNGSPAGMATVNKTKGLSVGDSLRAAVKEVRGSI